MASGDAQKVWFPELIAMVRQAEDPAMSMDAFAQAYATDEPRRAMQAFLDRRRPPGGRPPGSIDR